MQGGVEVWGSEEGEEDRSGERGESEKGESQYMELGSGGRGRSRDRCAARSACGTGGAPKVVADSSAVAAGPFSAVWVAAHCVEVNVFHINTALGGTEVVVLMGTFTCTVSDYRRSSII